MKSISSQRIYFKRDRRSTPYIYFSISDKYRWKRYLGVWKIQNEEFVSRSRWLRAKQTWLPMLSLIWSTAALLISRTISKSWVHSAFPSFTTWIRGVILTVDWQMNWCGLQRNQKSRQTTWTPTRRRLTTSISHSKQNMISPVGQLFVYCVLTSSRVLKLSWRGSLRKWMRLYEHGRIS